MPVMGKPRNLVGEGLVEGLGELLRKAPLGAGHKRAAQAILEGAFGGDDPAEAALDLAPGLGMARVPLKAMTKEMRDHVMRLSAEVSMLEHGLKSFLEGKSVGAKRLTDEGGKISHHVVDSAEEAINDLRKKFSGTTKRPSNKAYGIQELQEYKKALAPLVEKQDKIDRDYYLEASRLASERFKKSEIGERHADWIKKRLSGDSDAKMPPLFRPFKPPGSSQ